MTRLPPFFLLALDALRPFLFQNALRVRSRAVLTDPGSTPVVSLFQPTSAEMTMRPSRSRIRVSLGVLFLLLLCQCDSAGTGEDPTTPETGEPFSKIAFISNVDGLSQIFTMNPDGSDITQLTDDAGRKSHPDWSPDGRSLIFTVRVVDRTNELSLIDADGTNPRRLPNTRGEVNDPAWSPDGGRIAFSNRVDGNTDVYVIDLNGANLTRLTTHPAIDGNPDWAPDGSRLSFESKRDTR